MSMNLIKIFCGANVMIERCGLTRQAECTKVLEHCRGGNELKGAFERKIIANI